MHNVSWWSWILEVISEYQFFFKHQDECTPSHWAYSGIHCILKMTNYFDKQCRSHCKGMELSSIEEYGISHAVQKLKCPSLLLKSHWTPGSSIHNDVHNIESKGFNNAWNGSIAYNLGLEHSCNSSFIHSSHGDTMRSSQQGVRYNVTSCWVFLSRMEDAIQEYYPWYIPSLLVHSSITCSTNFNKDHWRHLAGLSVATCSQSIKIMASTAKTGPLQPCSHSNRGGLAFITRSLWSKCTLWFCLAMACNADSTFTATLGSDSPMTRTSFDVGKVWQSQLM